MKISNKFSVLAFFAALILLSPSCSKSDETDRISREDITLAQDDAYVEALFDEIDEMAIEEVQLLDAGDYNEGGLKSTMVCYTVSVNHPDTVTFPKVITIDFGTGCSVVFGDDTITRSGQIIITLTNRWFVPGAQHIVQFNNFYFNGNKVEGTRTLTNEGLNEMQNAVVSIELENGKITFKDNSFVTRNASHEREWIRNANPLLDTVLVTGSAAGVNVLGENYTRTIIEPLTLVHCSQYHFRWVITGGSIEVVNSERGTIMLQFNGDGCNSFVNVKKNGRSFDYQFRYRNRHQG